MIFNRLRYFIVLLCILCVNTAYSQIVIADALPGCLTIESTVGVSCDGGSTLFGINGLGQFEVTNIDGAACCSAGGGDNNSYFEFEEITIDCFEDVMISFDYSSSFDGDDFEDDSPLNPIFGCQGSNPPDGSHDQMVFTYSLDGGAEVQSLYVHGTTVADFTGTWIEGPLNGNTLTIRVYAANKASGEHFYFENLVIEAGTSSVTAGDDFTYCGDGPIPLDGSGNGTWSGGLGSFSDITNPLSTYSPNASEFGTTVTLTYAGCTPTASCASAVPSTDEVNITIFDAPTASIDQSSNGDLCFGECTTLSFDFIGGTEPYDLDLTFTISGVGFPVNEIIPNFISSDAVTVCYDITGIFPSYNAGSQTISVPEIAAGFSGTFTLNSFTDANGCDGTITGGGFTVSFLDTPEANFASLEQCDEGGGMATFDLTEMDNEVNGGSGETVNYYDDPGLTNEVFSPFIGPTSILYATVSNADCTSPAEEVEVIVLDNGDAGEVEMYCSEIGSINCTICDDDGTIGEIITILFEFNDPTLQHIVKLSYTDPTGTTELAFTLNPNETSLDFTISGLTTIEILEVTEGDDCIDNTDLGDIVTINYQIAPELDPIGPFLECGSVTLPAINGTGLSGSEMYFTMPNENGDSFAPGEIVTSTMDLYVYSGITDCFDEILVQIEILPGTTFDQPNDTIVCGPYTLLEITGTGVESTAVYYTLPNGNGNILIPGNLVLSSTTLYIFDPLSSCSSNEPSFSITINALPEINAIEDVDTCGVYELPIITGAMLTGNQTYYTEPNGMGIELMAGDTIFMSDTIYAFDNNLGCIDEVEIEIIIDEGPTAGVGDTISICGIINPQILNLPALLTVPADTLGMWSDDMGIIMDDTDSTLVDVTGISGVINFMYVIENMICGNDTSHLQVNLQQQYDAGGEDLITGCENDFSTLDLNSYWNIVGTDDTIIVLGGAAIDISDPSLVDVSMLDPGMYNLQYIVGVSDTICMPDTANLTIDIIESPDAGENVSTTTCAGNTVQLENVLVNNNGMGTFGDPGGTGALFGSTVNTAILGVGTFIFTHSVPGNGLCPSDIIEIEIEVTNDVTAGNSVIDTICFATEINLFDYLDEASLGGIFLNADQGNVEIPDGILVIDQWPSLPAGTAIMVTVLYKVGDNIDCAVSTSTIELLVLPEPIIDLQVLQNTICDNLLDIEIDYTYFFDFEFTIEINGSLPELPISIPFTDFDPSLPATDILALQLDLETYNLPSGVAFTIEVSSVILRDCLSDINSIPDTFYIGAQDTLLVNDMVCGNQSVTYNGQNYNATNPTDTITIPRAGQCDSLIIIDLDIQDPATSLINNTFCTGQSITVGGVVYDESNLSGMFIMGGDAANGCDSIVFIDLSFGDASINDVIQDICAGQELILNGIIYDENNLMASDTLFGGSAGGCDSIINVNLTPININVGMEMTTTCDINYSVIVNGVVYNFDNPQELVTIPGGSVSGCDSIVDVNLTFLDPATGIEDGSICQGEFIMINGNIYDESNLTGFETFIGAASNGCDSIVNVNLTLLEPAMGIEDGIICPGESIMVNGNTYDEDQLTGFETIAGAASNGCDSMVNINLTLLEIPMGDFINSSCDQDFSFTINGNVYDINNPMGTELISGGATNGCDSIANIQLSFDGITVLSDVIQPDCDDPENGQIIINSITGVAPYTYILNGVTTEIPSLPFIIDNLQGDGLVTVLDADGCSIDVNYSITLFIEVTLSYEIIDNQIIISGISEDSINTIEWTPTEGLSCTDCLNPVFDITEDTEYLLTINYSTDCIAQIIVPTTAEEAPIIPVYTVPNVFSPNGDGINDIFFIQAGVGASDIIASMTIYDRWGNQVYRKENYITESNVGWDGTFKGQALNPGVYVYLIEVLEGNVIKPIFGDVTIVK